MAFDQNGVTGQGAFQHDEECDSSASKVFCHFRSDFKELRYAAFTDLE